MKIETLEHFLIGIVAPMFPGSKVEKSQFTPFHRQITIVVYDRAPTRLRVRQNAQSTEYFTLTRLQKWDMSERRFVESLLKVYDETKATASPLLNQLEDFIVRRAVARTVATNEQAETLEAILDTFSTWSSQTYEGERVSSGVVITPNIQNGQTSLSFLELMQEDFGKILSDGVDSWWRVDAKGNAVTFETNDSTKAALSESGRFPLRYQTLAKKCSNGEVGITLNRNGEILVFAKSELQFAKRRGKWVYFTHEPAVRQMHGGGASSSALRQAIYESCLDVSFARSGACIGVVREQSYPTFVKKPPVSNDDLLRTSTKLKPRAAARLIGNRKFQNLPRLIRKELLALDGAVVLQWDGIVLAAGAILELQDVKRGNQGGRSAAAKALSRFGLGIKVSEDGMISGYKKETGEDKPVFNLG